MTDHVQLFSRRKRLEDDVRVLQRHLEALGVDLIRDGFGSIGNRVIDVAQALLAQGSPLGIVWQIMVETETALEKADAE